MSIFKNYFRFGRHKPSGRAVGVGSRATTLGGHHPLLHISLQFVAIVMGIFAQPVVVQARHGGATAIDFSFAKSGWIVASLVIAIVVFPGAYRPQNPSPQPRFVQFCVLFGAGIGWQAIFDTVVK